MINGKNKLISGGSKRGIHFVMTQEDATTLYSSNHFQTVSKPVLSPVKKRPPGAISTNPTSSFANSLPLSANL